MQDIPKKILDAISHTKYRPLKPKALARKIGVEKVDDKVVIDMIRFPSADDRGEGVIVEILGARGDPGVDTLSIIRSLNLPDAFPEDALAEARNLAIDFHENDLKGRDDFTTWQTITIDPVDARDFDDAV